MRGCLNCALKEHVVLESIAVVRILVSFSPHPYVQFEQALCSKTWKFSLVGDLHATQRSQNKDGML